MVLFVAVFMQFLSTIYLLFVHIIVGLVKVATLRILAKKLLTRLMMHSF